MYVFKTIIHVNFIVVISFVYMGVIVQMDLEFNLILDQAILI